MPPSKSSVTRSARHTHAPLFTPALTPSPARVCAARRYHPDTNSGCEKAAAQFVRVKEAYDSVLREALRAEQSSQERGSTSSDRRSASAQHSGGSWFSERQVGGLSRRTFNPLEQQRATVTMADFDLDYLTSVQAPPRPMDDTRLPWMPRQPAHPYSCPLRLVVARGPDPDPHRHPHPEPKLKP